MTRIQAMAAAAFLCAAPMAGAAASATSPAFDACLKNVSLDLRDCTSAELDRQFDELNAVYKRVMADLTPANRLKLRKEERAWMKFRQRHCRALPKQNVGGTLELVELDECWITENDKRIEALKRMAR